MAAEASKAAPLPKLALHLAVWDDNVNQLEALLVRKDIDLEYLDRNGNTPLLLAYRLGRTKLARMLLAAGAFSKSRTPEGFEAVQVAALTANPDLIREAVLAFLAETDAAFSRRLPGLQAALAGMPDFSLRLGWEFNSWVPLVSRLLPSDTYTISKRGTSLRLDTTLLGMNGMKWERGSTSLILWGQDTPQPGAMYVLDNEMKTVANARLAFTHPQDVHIQDWVRKLLTQKQKTTDIWSRDVVMAPVLKQGLFGSLSRGLGKLAFGDSTPRGRVSAKDTPTASAASTPVDPDDKPDESVDLDPADAVAPGSPSAKLMHVDDPRLVLQDVALWSNCSTYQMQNFCVRDVVHAPILPELKLSSWWKPEYSRQATEADVKAESDASKGLGPVAAGAGDSIATDEAPEKRLMPLLKALQAIRAGKINDKNAASATMEELEGMGFEDEKGKRTVAGQTVELTTFESYFGYSREKASPAAASTEAAADGALPADFVAEDGFVHRASAALGVFKKEAVTTDDKILDLKVLFSKEFPLTVEKFLPVAEMMSRTSRHAENFRNFFQSKFPVGAGFPVRFTIPVFPTITATITFEHIDVRRAPPKQAFEIPADFTMGAYVERGWIRQV